MGLLSACGMPLTRWNGAALVSAAKLWRDAMSDETTNSNQAAALDYYRCGMEKIRPHYVPARIRLYGVACGDGPFAGTRAVAGDYDCRCNEWGAVSIIASNGQMLGLRLNEFEPIAWQRNDKV